MELEATLRIQLSDEDIDDIMVTALEGGITYWCDEAKVVGNYLGEYASEQISRGGQLILHDFEDEQEHILTKEKFIEGFKKYIEAGHFFLPIDNETDDIGNLTGKMIVDTYNIDANAADSIIQYALFGEEVYG